MKDGCLKGLPCLCLCTSPELTVFVTDEGPAPASLIAMIAWIAACVIAAVWIASDCLLRLHYYYYSASAGMTNSAFLRLVHL